METKLKVKLIKRVSGDGSFGSRRAEPGVCDAGMNRHGAVWAVLPSGERLGLKPDEFVFADRGLEAIRWLRHAMIDRDQQAILADLYIRDVGAMETMLLQAARLLSDRLVCPWTAFFPQGKPEHCTAEIHTCTDLHSVKCWLAYLDSRRDLATCRRCGCTQDNACEGGCSWAEPDLCSSCVKTEEVNGG